MDKNYEGLWTGLGIIAVIFLPALAVLPVFGRLPTLATIGGILLAAKQLNVYLEKSVD